MRPFAPVVIALLLLAAPMALADDDDGHEQEPERHDQESGAELDAEDASPETSRGVDEVERKVKIETTEGRAVITMEREEGEAEDELKLDFNAREGWLKIEYRSENATSESDTELKVKLREIAEFEDQDGDAGYTPGVDRLVSSYSVEDLTWSMSAPADATSGSGEAGKKIVGTGAFPEGGSFGIVLYAYGAFAEVNGTTLKPTEVKIDLLLDDFPYQENGTLPALVLKAEQETEAKLEKESGSDDVRGVRAEANGYAAYFTWADSAYVDGAAMAVHVVELEAESDDDAETSKVEKRVSIAYARGAHINHDPVMGIASASAQPQEMPVPAPAVGAVLAAVVGLALALRRRSAGEE